jgi:uncharacterized protein (DUF433 family)
MTKLLERISIDPAVVSGKPVIAGTRIPVEVVIKHLAGVPDFDDLFAAYPRLTLDDVKACLEYAYARLVDEEVFLTSRSA